MEPDVARESGGDASAAPDTGATSQYAARPSHSGAVRPVDMVDTRGAPYQRAINWIDEHEDAPACVKNGIKLLQTAHNKKAWFSDSQGRVRSAGLKTADHVSTAACAKDKVAKYLVVYAQFRAAMGLLDLDAVGLIENDVIDLAAPGDVARNDDGRDGDERGIGRLPIVMYGDNSNASDLAQRVGAMIKQAGGSFEFNNPRAMIDLIALLSAHTLVTDVCCGCPILACAPLLRPVPPLWRVPTIAAYRPALTPAVVRMTTAGSRSTWTGGSSTAWRRSRAPWRAR